MHPTTNYTVIITPEQAGQRLDAVLAAALAQSHPEAALSRARVQALIAGGTVTINGKPVAKANTPVKADESYVVTVPEAVAAAPQAQAIPLSVVYEDEDLLVIDKPAGLVVHPAAGNHDGTLVNALLAHCGDSLSGIGGVKRPGIVHRLDKDTSGLMVVAKNDAAHQKLSAQFAAGSNPIGDGSRELSREYLALVLGLAPKEATIDAPIGRDPEHRQKMAVVAAAPDGRLNGRHAVTHISRDANYGVEATLVRCRLETGRTHQIRVHLLHLGYPVVGDPLYGKKRQVNVPKDLRYFPRQALHAARLKFRHPKTGKTLEFYAPLPDDMARLIENLAKA